MLIDIRHLAQKYNLKITGVLHVGAHECEEKDVYNQVGVPDEKISWIEGNPSIVLRMKNKGVKNIYNALVSDIDKDVEFIITNNGQSSSVLEMDEHKFLHPDVHEISRVKMKTTTLDNVIRKNNLPPFNFVNLDIQGEELRAMKGMGVFLDTVDYIYIEVNIKELYKNCAMIDEVDSFLKERGFTRLDTFLTQYGWGDAFYMRVN